MGKVICFYCRCEVIDGLCCCYNRQLFGGLDENNLDISKIFSLEEADNNEDGQ